MLKGKIEAKVKDVINEDIHATVGWDRFSLSLIRHFPNLSMGLEGLTVVNDAPFAGDTLVKVGNFTLSVDLMSALRGDAIEVKSIWVDHPVINLKVDADSIANWDIVPPSEEVEVEAEEGEAASFEVQLQSFQVSNGALSYSDATMDFSTSLKGVNAAMQGDLTESYTTIEMDSDIEALDLVFEKVKYINAAPIDLTASIGADMDNMVFTFEDNELNFSGVPLFMEGTLALLEEGYDMDLRLAASETDFKTLLALVPAEYMKDVEGLQTEGSMTLEATAKGVFVDADHLPAFNFLLHVMDGRIRYPDLPKSIDDIQVHMVVDNPGGSMDNTLTEIRSFHFELDNNPFDAHLVVSSPVSNATFKGG
ncbi:outer membrane assembly protein [Geofilum rubicundum JCM 15548]|uniref:Outer membrane assembly protein n=1 Tax=Geofilum rubicundum JCM 15548 TaxID=1236989 RepID=A0A0E9LR43_9BACT|nr:outer membrane assembly protein [Geofilum rubicundum JCM 15548]